MQSHIPAERDTEVQLLLERISELEQEVSNLKRLEDTIVRNASMFEALLAASADGITLTRQDGVIIRAVRSILGYGGNAAGLQIEMLAHPGDRHIMRESYRRLLEDREVTVHHRMRLRRSDGTYVWVEGTVTDMIDDPNVLAIVHNYRDVTRRQMAEMSALELSAVMEAVPFVVFSKGVDGLIQSWNREAQNLFGYEATEIIGQHVSNLIPADLRAGEEQTRKEVLEQRRPARVRTVRLHKNGTLIPMDVNLAPLIREGELIGIAHVSQPVVAPPA